MPSCAKIKPLSKRRLSGELYTRDPKIEERLSELSGVARDALIECALVSKKTDPKYVPSECLVYFIRKSWDDNTEAWFERLYKILAERVLRALPREGVSGGKTASLTNQTIRDRVWGRFVELLSLDRTSGSDKLDYFEVRFDGALASLRRDAQEQAWREENRSAPLEYDTETGELSEEVERAAGSFDLSEALEIDDPDYRSRWEAAIDTLPRRQMRIIQMLREGIPIDSKDPNIFTIAKALGKSEKTIRTHRDKAFAALREALNGDDQ
ncbi:RNA polymerase sigma factor [Hirschia baltica]|uniref:Response regulator receiver protein n=1 Tax=Hirschia baltica (strain ATCC 49814 / DSM 5838 / IFAM 1418) TaxID=582402 RepID=C6XP87_HIRBI|nr:response regulator receiver protein [Hirschia baltica ATCC 49814]